MQGLRLANNIHLTFKREEVLVKMRANLVRHRTILEEAKAGYLAQAEDALVATLEDVRAGKMVNIGVNLKRPQSHVKSYEAMIAMFEGAQEETLELSMEQHQAFCCDEWDWQIDFIASSARYSETATSML